METKRTGPPSQGPARNYHSGDSVMHTDAELIAWTAGYLAGIDRERESRVHEDNARWPPPKVRVLGRWYDQAARRQEWDRTAAHPRPTDFQGRR